MCHCPVCVQAVKQVTRLEPREATPYVGEALGRLRQEVRLLAAGVYRLSNPTRHQPAVPCPSLAEGCQNGFLGPGDVPLQARVCDAAFLSVLS